MKKTVSTGQALALALACMLVVGMLALAGCACSTTATSSSSSSEATTYTVPNVVSLTQADADKAIYASGLMVGKITQQPSDTVPQGVVISQSPEALTSAPANSKVDLVVSSGKEKAADVKVPDLKGKTQEEAEKALKEAGLVGVPSNPEETTEVDPGKVFKQSIAAGTTVKEGTSVAFTVALSPSTVAVPNVAGMTQADAKAALTKVGLGFDTTTAYDDKVAKDTVISQSIAPGKVVKAGTSVSVVVSLGPKPVENVQVPDVTTFSWADAQNALRSAGLACRYTGDPAGTVVSQDVAAGTMVAPNTLVTVTLASPSPKVAVPNLVGLTVTAAEAATDNLNLTLSISGSTAGVVVDQSPAAGTEVDERSTVYVTVQADDPWTTASDAASAASSAGISGFDVMDTVTMGSTTFNKPKFSYATHAVQALYEQPASVVCLRKGEGDFSVSLTERDLSSFPQKWTQNFKGLEITCYGNAQDAATVITWSIDNAKYALTYQGLGGSEMTMTPDDITSAVAGIQ